MEGYTTTGDFELQIPSTPSADIYAYGNGAEMASLIYPSTDIDLGEITLCPPPTPPPTGTMNFTLNGGPESYANQVIYMVTHKYGYYYPSSLYTSIEGQASDGSWISISFDGMSVGTYEIGTAGSGFIEYFPEWSDSFDSGTITVTRYDDEWGLIEVTINITTIDGTSVTGPFSVVRKSDQY